jgi:inosine-uridine nucleoside N-ribohydrolase
MKVPVVLDTDIGTDIDDTWALALLLRSPELDLKLVATASGDTVYRARLAARLLEIAGRTDVPVAVGPRQSGDGGPQAAWVEGYELAAYPGPVREDGVGAIVDCVMGSPEPVTLVCIGPLPNVAAALDREPGIASRARFVGMHGSIRRGYLGSDQVAAEYNVAQDPTACRRAFGAPWDVTVTPLDTCGLVQLDGERYRSVRDCGDPLVRAVLDNYRLWIPNVRWARGFDPEERSSILYDTVAVYLAFSEALLELEELGIRVTDEGFTAIDAAARPVRCATAWRDLPAFHDFLAERLSGPSP